MEVAAVAFKGYPRRLNRALLVALLLGFPLAIGAESSSPTLTVLYSFTGGADGSQPSGGLIADGGVLYGTTTYGGALGCGAVFSLTPPTSAGAAWIEKVLYTFTAESDGTYPLGLAIGPGGVLYGATAGPLFSLTPPAASGGAWTHATLYTFTGGSDGGNAIGAPVIGADGTLSGTTSFGGTGPCLMGCGTVYSPTPPATPGGAWIETILHSFNGGEEGAYYASPLVIGAGGVLYGTMEENGAYLGGYVFSFTPPATPGGAWTETVLHNFTAKSGVNPVGLAIDGAGVLYGSTIGGGTIYSLRPPASAGGKWSLAVLYNIYHYDYNLQQPCLPYWAMA